MLGALTQLTESQGVKEPKKEVSKPPAIYATPSTDAHNMDHSLKVVDPLRELVIASEDEKVDPEKLNFLAQSAVNLVAGDERQPLASAVAQKPQNQMMKNVKTLAGIFTGAETFVKKVEETKKKYSALDPSDSDGFGEVPILGKISRTKRVKSAHLRNSSAKSKFSDKRKLMLESDSSSTEPAEDLSKDVFKCINERRKCLETPPPSFADIAMSNEKLSVTVSESTLTVSGDGAGEENQSANVKEKKKKKRFKTAKTNRVAPMVDQRGCKSATVQAESEGSESPDPLEPWSTKKITNMNNLLAWEDQESI
nr:unnamed protein product [Callosobruchus chinensis]